MADEQKPSFQATYDSDGIARHLRRAPPDRATRERRRRMLGQTEAGPDTTREAPRSARSIAESFLRETAEPYLKVGPFPRGAPGRDAQPRASETERCELIFSLERVAGETATVVFEQSIMGLPIWNRGVTIQVDNEPGPETERVLSLQNHLEYGIKLEPVPTSGYFPENVTQESLADILGQPALASDLGINTTRRLVYRYTASERVDRNALGIGTDSLTVHAPSLVLPAVPAEIVEKACYVVTEVVFSMPTEPLGKIPWRAFIEPATRAVLYLRALVSACFQGAVFVRDPVSQGLDLGPDAAEADLDRCRETVDLIGLVPLSSGNGVPQLLKGEFIEIRDIEKPTVAPPTGGVGGTFTFSCHSSAFAAVCAYYNCDRLFRRMQELEFDVRSYFGRTRFPVAVDHAGRLGGASAWTHAQETGVGLGAFTFGVARAGVPLGMASCPRVAWHEFGHALLLEKVATPNFGFVHSVGDSLAAILNDPESEAKVRFATFPFIHFGQSEARSHGRRAEDGWTWGGAHDDHAYGSEQLLSSSLFRFYRMTGGDARDDLDQRRASARYAAYLIIQAVHTMAFTTTRVGEFVDCLVSVDFAKREFDGKSGGRLHKVLRWSFEAQGLRLASGEADIFIDDGRAGEYAPYIARAGECPNVWSRRQPDGGLDNELPIVGQLNFLYARVGNKGRNDAQSVTLDAYRATTLVAPRWPDDWEPIGDAQHTNAVTIAGGAERIIGPVEWFPNGGENRLLVAVEDSSDPSNLAGLRGTALMDDLVPFDNNLATRTFSP